jgi:hypothetical protein
MRALEYQAWFLSNLDKIFDECDYELYEKKL